MEKTDLLADQYADASNLDTRGAFNDRYTVVDRHPHEWLFDEVTVADESNAFEETTDSDEATSTDGATVLDVGCGPGAFWTCNADRVPDSWRPLLVDFSAGMVRSAREALGEAETGVDDSTTAAGASSDTHFAVADAGRLPLVDDAADVVVASQMLYHLPDLDRGLAELRRVLAPDGRLYATTGSERNAAALWDLMSDVADGEVSSLAGGFTAENGRAVLGGHFDAVERWTFENRVRVDDPDALVAYALSLPLDAEPLSAFEPDDADALRERAAARIDREGAIEWRKDLVLFVASD